MDEEDFAPHRRAGFMPAFALLKIEDDCRPSENKPRSLLQVMDAMEGGDFEFEAPRMCGECRPADLG